MKGTERDWLLDVAGELFKMMAGVNMVHVQYRGDAGGKASEPFAMRHLTVPNSRSGSIALKKPPLRRAKPSERPLAGQL
jgi:hypothetical protein